MVKFLSKLSEKGPISRCADSKWCMLVGFILLLLGSFTVFLLSISQGGEIAPRDAGCTTDFFPIERSGQAFCSLDLVNYVSPFRFAAPAYGCHRDVQCPWPNANSVMRYMATFLGMGVSAMSLLFLWSEIWTPMKKNIISTFLYGTAVFQFACFCIDANSYRVGSGFCELGFFQYVGQISPTTRPSMNPGRRLANTHEPPPTSYESVVPLAENYSPSDDVEQDGTNVFFQESIPSSPPAVSPSFTDAVRQPRVADESDGFVQGYSGDRRRLAPSPFPTHPGQQPTNLPAQRPTTPHPGVQPSPHPTEPICQFASIFGRQLNGIQCDNALFQTVVAVDFFLAFFYYIMVLVFRTYLRFLGGDRKNTDYDEVPESNYDSKPDPRDKYKDDDYEGDMNVPSTIYEDDNREVNADDDDDDKDYGGRDPYANAAEDGGSDYGSTKEGGGYGDNAYNDPYN